MFRSRKSSHSNAVRLFHGSFRRRVCLTFARLQETRQLLPQRLQQQRKHSLPAELRMLAFLLLPLRQLCALIRRRLLQLQKSRQSERNDGDPRHRMAALRELRSRRSNVRAVVGR